jgi:hypothetical protein
VCSANVDSARSNRPVSVDTNDAASVLCAVARGSRATAASSSARDGSTSVTATSRAPTAGTTALPSPQPMSTSVVTPCRSYRPASAALTASYRPTLPPPRMNAVNAAGWSYTRPSPSPGFPDRGTG